MPIRRDSARRGMTLIELIVGILVLSMVAAATAFTVSRSVRSSSAAESRERVRASAHLVAERVAQDVAGVLRDGDLYYARVLLIDGEAEVMAADGSRYRTRADELLLFSQSPVSARSSNRGQLGEDGEGGEFEVQYRLASRQTGLGGRSYSERGRVFFEDAATGEAGVLWRRVDPQPDETPDGGGVVFPVMESVTEFSVEALEEDRWVAEWDSDRQGYPHALRVTVRVVEPESFGSPRREAVARKTVAIDRVPLPYVFVAPEDRGEDEEDE